MRKMQISFPVIIFLLCVAPRLSAQFNVPVETRNAALRYWQAFAEMHDLPADSSTSALLEQTIMGGTHWDEAKLGPVFDMNQAAILRMQRATKLPECDWGAEYSVGPDASIAFLAKARVMAALNTLYGERQIAKGDPHAAVETWLAGIRFAQHVAQGGSLIFALTARPALVQDLGAMAEAAQAGKIAPGDRQQIAQIVRALPETGFDWGQAFFLDEYATEVFVQQLVNSRNPAELYVKTMGSPMPAGFVVPSQGQCETFRKFVLAVSEAYRLPPDQSETKLRALQGQIKDLAPFFQQIIPTFKMNNQRVQIAAARQRLLNVL